VKMVRLGLKAPFFVEEPGIVTPIICVPRLDSRVMLACLVIILGCGALATLRNKLSEKFDYSSSSKIC